METNVILSEKSPKKTANIFSKILFIWLIEIIKNGNKNGLSSLNDLYTLDNSDKSSNLGDKLEDLWLKEFESAKKSKRKPKLMRALLKMFWKNYLFHGFLMFLHMGVLRIFQPIIIAVLIEIFNEKNQQNQSLIIYGASLVILTVLIAFINNHSSLNLMKTGMQVRIACGSLIYRKTLKLSQLTLNAHVSGQIINILSNDMNRFEYVTAALHVIWILPIKLLLISYFMWDEIGISFLSGISGMMLMTVFIQGCSGKLSSYFRKKTVIRTENRLNLLKEFLAGIVTIKMSSWETPFKKLLVNSRIKESKFLIFTSYMTALYETCILIVEKVASYFTLTCYYFLGHQITSDKVFFLSQCHNVLQMSMAVFFPMAVQLGAECKVSIKNIEEILMLDSNQESAEKIDSYKEIKNTKKINNPKIILKNVSTNSNGFTLKNINLEINPGELIAIIGPVGSGKTTLLNLFLKELTPKEGEVEIPENISFCSQTPWLFNSSIKKNIIFNQQFDKTRYQQILKLTTLNKDIENQSNRDNTFVGEKGMFLSGGQKSRINLARSIYKESDLYIFDDPFSALDAQLAKSVFEKCVLKFLRGKTRIVVTHNLEILKDFDKIVIMSEGGIETQGNYSDLLASRNDYLISSLQTLRRRSTIIDIDVKMSRRKPSLISRLSSLSLLSTLSETQEDLDEKTTKEVTLKQGFLPYKEYLKSTGGFIPITILAFLMISAQISSSLFDYFITIWANSSYSIISNTDFTYFYIFTFSILLLTLLTTIRSFYFFKLSTTAANNLHTSSIEALSKTSIQFYDETPSGRILNRFSKDVATIDTILPRVVIESLQIFLQTIGIMVMICLCNYYLVVAVVVIFGMFVKFPVWYLGTSRKIKHLEGIAKSPILSHLATTLDGIVTIRTFRSEREVVNQFDGHQDVHTSAMVLMLTCLNAFNLWLDLLAVIFVFFIVFGFIILSQVTSINGSFVGLAITQGMILTRIAQHGVRQTTEVINQITSVERIVEYKTLPPERTKLDSKKFDDWPKKGQIEFKDVSLKYSEFDGNILKHLNFLVNHQEKIGIVGRSGAGKSSIISAIFRMAKIEGSIKIDEINTESIPLNVLRDKISIIPQEPALFSASVRFNLDPWNKYEDSQIWNALNEVDLKGLISNLDVEIENAGSNLSMGQKQQICLARAILRNNKILIMDEATANMDTKTDDLIQKTIKKHFKHCTILTVAHRLETIIDSNRVMVLSFGHLEEMDHPYLLLQNKNSSFYKLAYECGPINLKELIDISSKSFQLK
ncbi:ATP-binding cassette sub-family C member 4-like [Onthophagus taurus]|uniref:ATP-binding cassette sub-family C member 4-like n=1 Tax=Onthophagus taurus TaxID=166361 RepID=UPI0039BDB6DD